MSTWAKIGLTNVGLNDLDRGSRERLTSQNGEGRHLSFFDPSLIDELAIYLLGAGVTPDRYMKFTKLRNGLMHSAQEYSTADGRGVILLAESHDRVVSRRLSELREEDVGGLRSLGDALAEAGWTLARDGRVMGESAATLSSWSRAAGALESFLSDPRRARLFDLEDFLLRGVDGIYALAECVELLRRLLLAAGRAMDELGAATLGHHDFSGPEDAVATWHVSRGGAARRLAATLALLTARLTGALTVTSDDFAVPDPAPGETAWIEECSRVGQDVMRWVYGRGEASLNFAAVVGAAWPGPALYGYDDGEEEPSEACRLCAALDGGACGGDILFGTYEAVVAGDFSVEVPPLLLDGDGRAYVSESPDEPGVLYCQGERRRFASIARLISEEWGLGRRVWGLPGEMGGDALRVRAEAFEEEFALRASGEPVDLANGRMPLEDFAASLDAGIGSNVSMLGVGDHFEIVETERHERWERENGFDATDISDLFFEG